MDSAISGVIDKKKVGGIYGHFFRDLPHDIKEKLSKKFRENKSLIEQEGNRNHVKEAEERLRKEAERKRRGEDEHVDTFQPVTGMSKMRKAMEDKKGYADPDVGTQTEAEMMEELYISARKKLKEPPYDCNASGVQLFFTEVLRLFGSASMHVFISREWCVESWEECTRCF